MREIIEALDTKVFELNKQCDALLDACATGESLPEGFNNWFEVENVVDNKLFIVEDLQKAIGILHKYKNIISL